MEFRCETCSFELWTPVLKLQAGFLGLYDDARFPGRCLLPTLKHFAELGDMPGKLRCTFVDETTQVADAIRRVTKATRVNYAVLGNAEPHVHFHLIPRYAEREQFPNRSPWDDPRPKTPLVSAEKERLVSAIRKQLDARNEGIREVP
jgi:diadenosine tetraphosphate (Ap4A) HIT family hydrolase